MTDDEDEVFVPCPDYPDLFAIGSFGSLYSFRSRRLVAQTPDHAGYPRHATRVGGRKGESLCVRIHVQVAKAFVPNYDRERHDTVNHLDLDKSNGRYSNLEWTDRQGNVDHAVEAGCYNREKGFDSSLTKLSKHEFEDALEMLKTTSIRATARHFGISHTTLMKMIKDHS